MSPILKNWYEPREKKRDLAKDLQIAEGALSTTAGVWRFSGAGNTPDSISTGPAQESLAQQQGHPTRHRLVPVEKGRLEIPRQIRTPAEVDRFRASSHFKRRAQ